MADLLIRDARPVIFRSRGELARLRAAGPRPMSAGPTPPTGGDGSDRRGGALVDAGWGRAHEPVDLRIADGIIAEVGRPGHPLPSRGEPELSTDGAWALPGLWDAHAHLDLLAAQAARLDTAGARTPEEVLARVAPLARAALAADGAGPAAPTIQGFGHRLSEWSRTPTVAELDAVTGRVPTVLISGDVHSGWLNSAALAALGLPVPRTPDEADRMGPVSEDPWFAAMNRLTDLPGTAELVESGFGRVLGQALARGVTGIVDMETPADPGVWGRRATRLLCSPIDEDGAGSAGAHGAPPGSRAVRGPGPGAQESVPGWSAGERQGAASSMRTLPRIRAAIYRQQLDRWRAAGLRSGSPLPGAPAGALLTQGPLKVIADGSLGAMTALVVKPYPAALGLPPGRERGVANIGRGELTDLMRQAAEAGFEMAVHAIGDQALLDAVAAFAASGARGRIEHAQLLPGRARTGACGGADAGRSEGAASGPDPEILARIAALGLELSVQPAHLVDDWPAVTRIWPGRAPRCYCFADLMMAGIGLHLGSDAPVAPLDPWLAMSVAVSRRAQDGSVWSPSQRLTPEEALAASTDGQGSIRVGSRGDVVLVDRDPLAPSPDDEGDASPGGWPGAPAHADAWDAAAERLRATRVLATVVAGRPA